MKLSLRFKGAARELSMTPKIFQNATSNVRSLENDFIQQNRVK